MKIKTSARVLVLILSCMGAVNTEGTTIAKKSDVDTNLQRLVKSVADVFAQHGDQKQAYVWTIRAEWADGSLGLHAAREPFELTLLTELGPPLVLHFSSRPGALFSGVRFSKPSGIFLTPAGVSKDREGQIVPVNAVAGGTQSLSGACCNGVAHPSARLCRLGHRLRPSVYTVEPDNIAWTIDVVPTSGKVTDTRPSACAIEDTGDSFQYVPLDYRVIATSDNIVRRPTQSHVVESEAAATVISNDEQGNLHLEVALGSPVDPGNFLDVLEHKGINLKLLPEGADLPKGKKAGPYCYELSGSKESSANDFGITRAEAIKHGVQCVEICSDRKKPKKGTRVLFVKYLNFLPTAVNAPAAASAQNQTTTADNGLPFFVAEVSKRKRGPKKPAPVHSAPLLKTPTKNELSAEEKSALRRQHKEDQAKQEYQKLKKTVAPLDKKGKELQQRVDEILMSGKKAKDCREEAVLDTFEANLDERIASWKKLAEHGDPGDQYTLAILLLDKGTCVLSYLRPHPPVTNLPDDPRWDSARIHYKDSIALLKLSAAAGHCHAVSTLNHGKKSVWLLD
ncbi:hypothetical protein FACS189472_00940 [Alphaproteobacteria bacterium]|nr:hypothetical protein FACS189472_00940 [Alphaproteobacteria bacterium]